jgi:hypothetical protein
MSKLKDQTENRSTYQHKVLNLEYRDLVVFDHRIYRSYLLFVPLKKNNWIE